MKTTPNWLQTDYHYYHADQFPGTVDGLSYFALTDALIHQAADYQQAMLYFWPTDKFIFLGMIDTKIPYLKDGLEVLKSAGYRYLVRNSGGLAVVSDPGILNFSMIFPDKGDERLKINDAYERMHWIISESLAEYDVQVLAEEIPDSYCPGDYDLSINGRKIAGISQRRIRGGSAIMIYLGINGDQDSRSNLIKEFYQAGIKNQEVKWSFPDINPSVMTTVSAEIGYRVEVEDVVKSITKTFQKHGKVIPGTYTDEMMRHYQDEYKKMIDRNDKLLGDLFKEGGVIHDY